MDTPRKAIEAALHEIREIAYREKWGKQPPTLTEAHKRDRDAVVQGLERWYFGKTFREYKGKTEVGNWRDIVNEAASRIVRLQDQLAHYETALKELSVLGGGRSHGNFIAQHALKHAPAPTNPSTQDPQ